MHRDVDRELESYLEHEIADNIARGMSEAEARRAAHHKLGNRTAISEEVYEMNRLHLLESFWRDLAQGLRQLRRHPGFALAGVTILALGIAATTAIFSIAYGVLLRDLPYDHPDRLVSINGTMPKQGLPKANAGIADYFDFRRDQQVFEDMALTRAVGNFNLTGDGEPERLQGARTTPSLFSTLRAMPLMGRVFTEEERSDPAKADSVAVLSFGLWQRRFGRIPRSWDGGFRSTEGHTKCSA